MIDTGKFEGWCVVEVFGHQKFAGYVREEALGGASFVRVDVPEVRDGERIVVEAFTKLFGGAAIYSISPVSEEYARRAAGALKKVPVDVYMPRAFEPHQPALEAEYTPDDEDDF